MDAGNFSGGISPANGIDFTSLLVISVDFRCQFGDHSLPIPAGLNGQSQVKTARHIFLSTQHRFSQSRIQFGEVAGRQLELFGNLRQ